MNARSQSPLAAAQPANPASNGGGIAARLDAMVDQLLQAIDDEDELSDEQRNSVRRSLTDAQQSLERTGDSLQRARRKNDAALRQASRQVQLNRAHAPNIVLILADDLGYGDLGSYGQTHILTPHLDRLAAEGVRSSHYYAGSPLDLPSRYTVHTGLHTGHAWLRDDLPNAALRQEDCMLAEVLWQAGYTTAGAGVWKLGGIDSAGDPQRQGFDEWYGLLGSESANDLYPAFFWRRGVQVAIPENADNQPGRYLDDLITAEAIDYLRRRREQPTHRDGRPFFLFVSYPTPDAHNDGPPRDLWYADHDWPEAARKRAARITHLDRDVGLLLASLDHYDLAQNTVVIFTSDNGPRPLPGANPDFFQSTRGLRGGFGDLYEGGIRVPMIIRWPGRRAAGSVNHTPWASWDLLPTLAELVRAWARPVVDGVSQMPVIHGRAATERRYLYWELPPTGRAIRLGRWKGVRINADEPWQLYDLEYDQAETTDLSADHPEIIEQFKAIEQQTHREPDL